MTVVPIFAERTINELLLLQKGRHINLEPGFQRNSVWTDSDRRRLIQSISAGYPLPSIFLYQRQENGRLVYDVIDGKQRLETIFKFLGVGKFKRDRFEVKLEMDGEYDWWDWRRFTLHGGANAARLLAYKLQIVEVTGSLNEIVDLFVRINSTGKRLTSGEKRNAKYYTSPFLKCADRLVIKFRRAIETNRILSAAQIDRLNGT
jgi:hypothetical protein